MTQRSLSLENIITAKKERLKLTPELLFNIYLECTAPGAPVKAILARHGLKPWDLVAIRKKVRAGAIEALANAKPGRRKHVVAVEQFQQVSKELGETKDALAAVGHELSLLKKRVN
jgi:hypothetical protein